MNQTPLYEWHVSHGAKMVDFAGWMMPVYYSSILDEHHAVRTAAGLFDVCHMGRLRVSGTGAFDLLQYAFTNDLEGMAAGRAKYGLFCNADAGVLDDAIIYRLANAYLVVPNASNKDRILAHLQQLIADRGLAVQIEDQSASTGMAALQGPASKVILNSLASERVDAMPRFSSAMMKVAGIEAMVARTGYTGEDGFELICDASQIVALWDAAYQAGQAHGLKPAGLGARDALRIEACLPLYGHELSLQTNPLFAGLRVFIKLSKSDFVGKRRMEDWRTDEHTRHLVAFAMVDRAIPREGCEVHGEHGVIGQVTSGVFSPILKQGIGMAYIESAYVRPGTKIYILIRNKQYEAKVMERPLYRAEAGR